MALEVKVQESRVHAPAGIRLATHLNGEEVGRTTLWVLPNESHGKPFGLIEDVFVAERHRGKNIGEDIVEAAIEAAKKNDCYKAILTSRFERPWLHLWYRKLGFKKDGFEFRIDF